MESLEARDIALLAVAGYIGVMALVRLMIGHRNRVAREIAEEIRREQQRKAGEEKSKISGR
jgi:ribosomal silencing factor RsfS